MKLLRTIMIHVMGLWFGFLTAYGFDALMYRFDRGQAEVVLTSFMTLIVWGVVWVFVVDAFRQYYEEAQTTPS